MRPENRLLSLLKSHQIEERITLHRLAEVLRVVERRRQIYDKALNLKKTVLERLETFRRTKRHGAFAAGRIRQVVSIDSFVKRLNGDLSQLETEERLRSAELRSAEERASGVEQQLVDIRIERKKIELYIENLSRRKRAVGVAREESQMDELAMGRRNRGN